MASEIRVNKINNRAGLGTITIADTGVVVNGIVTCTEVSGLNVLNIAGVSTFASTLDINGDIDVDGHTNLDNVSVAGVSTFSDMVEISGSSFDNGGVLTLRNTSAINNDENIANINIAANDGPSGFHTGAQIKFQSGNNWSNDATYTDIVFKHANASSGSTLVDALKISGTATDVSSHIAIGRSALSNQGNYYLAIKGYERSSQGATGDAVNIGVFNQSGDTQATAGIDFRLGQAAVSNTAAVRLIAGKTGGWTNTASTRDGYFKISVAQNAQSIDRFTIRSNGNTGIGTMLPLSGLHISDGTAYGSPQNSSRKATLTISAGSEGSSDIQLLSANYNHIFFGDSTDPNTGIIWYEHTGGGTDSMHFSTAGTERLRITSTGNLGVAGATGTDFSLLDGMVINTANGRAGLIINSSSSSHNAYMSFGYGSGSGTSHHDQFSAYIGRVGDNNLILGTNNSIRVQVTSSGHVVPGSDSTYDLGLTGTRWRNLYADTLYGDGSNLTGISGVTINNNADNRIITGSGTANTLNGEGGLTFNGTNLVMSTDAGRILLTRNFGEAGILIGSGNAGGATLYLDGDSNGDWSGGDYAYIRHATNGHLQIVATNPADNGAIDFYTGANTYYGSITSDGRLSLNGNGNTRAIEINAGSNGGSIVIDRNGHITSLIRASDGGSNVGGSSGGGARISLGKNQMHFKTYPYVSNVGDAVTYTTRASIDTSGNFVPGSNNTYNLGTSSLRWANLYINDLQLSNEAKKDEGGNDVDGTWGDWTLQEGENKIFMINNRTGKKYSLKMEEE